MKTMKTKTLYPFVVLLSLCILLSIVSCESAPIVLPQNTNDSTPSETESPHETEASVESTSEAEPPIQTQSPTELENARLTATLGDTTVALKYGLLWVQDYEYNQALGEYFLVSGDADGCYDIMKDHPDTIPTLRGAESPAFQCRDASEEITHCIVYNVDDIKKSVLSDPDVSCLDTLKAGEYYVVLRVTDRWLFAPDTDLYCSSCYEFVFRYVKTQ